MPRHNPGSSPPPDINTQAGRVAWLLIQLFDGNMRRMAEAIGVTHSVLSKVVAGHQGPGRRLIESIASHPKVNAGWLITGEGVPLMAESRNGGDEGWSIPVARTLLPGSPTDHAALMTGARVEVTKARCRETAYFYRFGADDPIVSASAEKAKPGDLLLLDADVALWRSNRRMLDDALVVLRVGGRGVQDYALARTRCNVASGSLMVRPYGFDRDASTREDGGQPGHTMVGIIRRPGRGIELDGSPDESPGNPSGQERPRGWAAGVPTQSAVGSPDVDNPSDDHAGEPERLDIEAIVAIAIMIMRQL